MRSAKTSMRIKNLVSIKMATIIKNDVEGEIKEEILKGTAEPFRQPEKKMINCAFVAMVCENLCIPCLVFYKFFMNYLGYDFISSQEHMSLISYLIKPNLRMTFADGEVKL